MPHDDSPFVLSKTTSITAVTPTGSPKKISVVKGKRQQRWVFNPKDVIFYEGEKGKSAFFIEDGEIAIVKKGGDGKPLVPIARLGRGDIFGELAMIDDACRSASAIVVKKVVALELEREDFAKELDDMDPRFAEDFRRMLSFIRRMPPRTMWSVSGPPTFSQKDLDDMADIVIARRLTARRMESSFIRELYLVMTKYVIARLPEQNAASVEKLEQNSMFMTADTNANQIAKSLVRAMANER